MKTYGYCWLHIPSGKTGMRTVNLFNQDELLIALDRWNKQQPGVWQYWSKG